MARMNKALSSNLTALEEKRKRTAAGERGREREKEGGRKGGTKGRREDIVPHLHS